MIKCIYLLALIKGQNSCIRYKSKWGTFWAGIIGVKSVNENLSPTQVVQTHIDQNGSQPLKGMLFPPYSSHIILTMENFASSL